MPRRKTLVVGFVEREREHEAPVGGRLGKPCRKWLTNAGEQAGRLEVEKRTLGIQ